jgi:hypothetical protein
MAVQAPALRSVSRSPARVKNHCTFPLSCGCHLDNYVRVMVLQTTLLGYNDRHSPFLLLSQFSYPKRRNLCLYIVRRSLPQRTHLTQVESSHTRTACPAAIPPVSARTRSQCHSPGAFRGRFLESRQTSKEKRGNRRGEDVSCLYDTRKSRCIGGIRCLIANKYPSRNRRCQAVCRM